MTYEAAKVLADEIRKAWTADFGRTFEYGDEARAEIAARVACDKAREWITWAVVEALGENGISKDPVVRIGGEHPRTIAYAQDMADRIIQRNKRETAP